MILAVGVLACLGGCAPGPAAIAEFERPATDADRLPAGWDLTGLVFPGTIRYAGTVDEVRVYVQTSGVELRLVGTGAEVPDGYERLSDSVVLLDRAGLSRLVG